MAARFLTRAEVAAELNVSESQVYALIRRGDLRAMKVGRRGVYRVGFDDLQLFIAHAYEQTAQWIEAHPFSEVDEGQTWAATWVRTSARARARRSNWRLR